ncbi:MAG: Uma2 family endonuclease [Clostridiales bacterium]|jgi:Uma2 family endonuclease|nr:Uma2 family endonuclease [Clostridiales bacterium]
MNANEARQSGYYRTFDEWYNKPENERSELYDGVLVMVAEPTLRHQDIVWEILRQISNFLLSKLNPAKYIRRLSGCVCLTPRIPSWNRIL